MKSLIKSSAHGDEACFYNEFKTTRKKRIFLEEIEWGDLDDDGQNIALYKGKQYSGYAVIDHLPDGRILSECEYKNGSQLGWENEYNEKGILVYSSLAVGPFLSLENFRYDENGKLSDHWKPVGEKTYHELCIKYNLLD